METKENHQHSIGYNTYVFVWFALLALTAITVTVAGINLGGAAILIAMLIAMVKAGFVLYIFMHIKFDDIIFRVFIGITAITFVAVFIFTFFDYWLR
ncbi:MAG: cytochrome C oxidase subunit IV family protein [Syntrophothermus sp.]